MMDIDIFKPAINELIKYYREFEGIAGDSCHLILDQHLDEGNLYYFQEECERQNDVLGHLIATVLCSFTSDERDRVMGIGL